MKKSAVSGLFFLLTMTAAFAGDAGWFGMALDVDTGGSFFSPTVNSARVAKLAPDSPASKAGMAVGDQLIEIDGHAVQNGSARELKPLLSRNIGEPLRLRLQRSGGEQYSVTLVAVPKPTG